MDHTTGVQTPLAPVLFTRSLIGQITSIKKLITMAKYVILPASSKFFTEVYFVPLNVFLDKLPNPLLSTDLLRDYMKQFAVRIYFGNEGDEILESLGMYNHCNETFTEISFKKDFSKERMVA
jgi:hypothetical protein